MIKKSDIILTICLVIIGLAMTWYFTTGRSDAQMLQVTVDSQIYGNYQLSQDQVITIKQGGHTNKITIHNGSVSMEFSDCHGQDCVRSHAISKSGEQIVCLPNKVVLEIKGGDNGIDAVAR